MQVKKATPASQACPKNIHFISRAPLPVADMPPAGSGNQL